MRAENLLVRRRYIILSTLLLTSAACILGLLLLGNGSRMNATRRYVDVKYGRVRKVHWLFGVRISDEISDTDFSQMYRRTVGELGSAEWRPSGHLRGALGSMQSVARCLSDDAFTDTARREAVLTYLYLLRDPYPSQAYYHYEEDLWEILIEHRARRENESLDVCDLPEFFEIRVDVFGSDSEAYRVVQRKRIGELPGKRIEGARVRWQTRIPSLSDYTLTTGPDGRGKLPFTIGGLHDRDAWAEQPNVGFQCEAEGYRQVSGTFRLEDFRGKAAEHGSSLLVTMKAW